MSEEPSTPNTNYRARPLPANQSMSERVRELQPEQRVVVNAKNWKKSLTVVINGSLLVAASIVAVLDILFGSNVIEPIVSVFTNDPQRVSTIITTITQVYTALNLYLRFKTTQPVTLRTDVK